MVGIEGLVLKTAEMPHANGAAIFDESETYRYSLDRIRDIKGPLLACIGLNPSTATESDDDPTIRRCVGYARAWGFGGIAMLNLFAFRATDPRTMKAASDPIGPCNDRVLEHYASRVSLILAAWGAHGSYMGRGEAVRSQMESSGKLYALRLTSSGHPGHPLYLPKALIPRKYLGGKLHEHLESAGNRT
jgi:hypothetical protein